MLKLNRNAMVLYHVDKINRLSIFMSNNNNSQCSLLRAIWGDLDLNNLTYLSMNNCTIRTSILLFTFSSQMKIHNLFSSPWNKMCSSLSVHIDSLLKTNSKTVHPQKQAIPNANVAALLLASSTFETNS